MTRLIQWCIYISQSIRKEQVEVKVPVKNLIKLAETDSYTSVDKLRTFPELSYFPEYIIIFNFLFFIYTALLVP